MAKKSKFVWAVLKANGYQYSFEELLENTYQVEALKFVIDYQKALFPVTKEAEDDVEGK